MLLPSAFRFRRFIYRSIVFPVHVEDLSLFPDSQLVLPVIGIDHMYELIAAVYVEDIQPTPGLFSISCLDPSYYI